MTAQVPSIRRLVCKIQAYDWGSREEIARLQDRPTPTRDPEAELWMGDHPMGVADVEEPDGVRPLTDLIESDPEGILGTATAKRWGPRLPFLAKLLAAADPLSIQLHPSAREAAEGFARENRLGVALDARNRNYRDPNAKIEMLVALRPISALCGLRPLDQCRQLLARLASPPLERLSGTAGSSADLFRSLLALGRGEGSAGAALAAAVAPTVRAAATLGAEGHWAAQLADRHPHDPLLVAPFLFHLVTLEPGQALAIHPGTPHSHLLGTGFEVMTNSDNVLRGGLTHKHVDATELGRILDPSEAAPVVSGPKPEAQGVARYASPCDAFSTWTLETADDRALTWTPGNAVRIVCCVDGYARVTAPGADAVELPRGQAAIIPACLPEIEISGQSRLFAVTGPS